MIGKIFHNRYYLCAFKFGMIGLCMLCSCNPDLNNVKVNPTKVKGFDKSLKVEQLKKTQKTDIVYNVDTITRIALPKKLMEISGLTIDASGDNLYAVNDEKAILFQLSQEGKILSQIDFGKNADYEGVEKVGNSVFILKSNGKIIEFDLLKSEKVDTYNNPLSLTNDAEGLGYDASSHSLLIACKGSPNIKSNPKLKKTKAVYAFDIESKQLIEKPILTIVDDHIEQYIKTNYQTKLSKKKYKKKLHRAISFSPSAIALNPIDGNFYILSTVGKTLIVTNHNSEVKSIYFLDNAAYIQPEGICFDGQANMWISNEGKGLQSNMVKALKPN